MKKLLASFAFFTLIISALAQGGLTPPGAPAPTMKSLAQIELHAPKNYVVAPGNDLGPIGNTTNSTSPWANISH